MIIRKRNKTAGQAWDDFGSNKVFEDLNKIYNSGEILEQIRSPVKITRGVNEYDVHWTISFMKHIKLLISILLEKINKKRKFSSKWWNKKCNIQYEDAARNADKPKPLLHRLWQGIQWSVTQRIYEKLEKLDLLGKNLLIIYNLYS